METPATPASGEIAGRDAGIDKYRLRERIGRRRRYARHRKVILQNWQTYYGQHSEQIAERKRGRYYQDRGLPVPEVPTPRFRRPLKRTDAL